MANPPDHFVVYGDMLGFRDLVLMHQTVEPDTLTYRRQTSRLMAASLQHGNPLQRRLKNFHAKLDNAAFETQWPAEVSMMVFSDSVFLATVDGASCMEFCQQLLRECIVAQIPLRMGVGFGTFISNSLAFEVVPRAKVINSQFLGTGVVFASDAEKTIKGLRIGLHPSAVAALESFKPKNDRRLPLPAGQASAHVSHEWNYLPERDSSGAGVRQQRDDIVRHLQKMAEESAPQFQLYYENTIAAVDRMREQMHTDWMSITRRR